MGGFRKVRRKRQGIWTRERRVRNYQKCGRREIRRIRGMKES